MAAQSVLQEQALVVKLSDVIPVIFDVKLVTRGIYKKPSGTRATTAM